VAKARSGRTKHRGVVQGVLGKGGGTYGTPRGEGRNGTGNTNKKKKEKDNKRIPSKKYLRRSNGDEKEEVVTRRKRLEGRKTESETEEKGSEMQRGRQDLADNTP